MDDKASIILDTMQFYEVFVSELKYQKDEPLTYSYDQTLETGDLVSVPFGSHEVSGFVYRKVTKPSFKTKQINEKYPCKPLHPSLIKLHQWMLNFYPYGSGPISKLFLPNIGKFNQTTSNSVVNITAKATLPPLTKEQARAINIINQSGKKSFLLHGETGSGKTRIYQELAKQTLSNNQSIVILVPEISLVNQTYDSFVDICDNVVILHSGLTKKQQRDNWQSLHETANPTVLMGTRSAIFAPIHNLGLVVIDEMHENTYKQDSSPRYSALRVAAKRSSLCNAQIVYGSATPSISEYFMAEKFDIPIIKLTQKAKKSNQITKTIIDIKDRNSFSLDPYISNKLIKALEARLKNQEQSMLFLNRRGTAKQILCQNCGWQALCPRCDLPMTLHADVHKIRCHTCGYSQNPIYSCPECKNNNITYRSIGTKAIVDSVKKLLPEANIKRFDTDNSTAEKLSNHFDDIKSGKIDIVVGTQMLGKGLDLPKLSLVGIINADISLSMPDFSSVEKNYQLIHQAIGRVGRGHIDGEVILQTFHPNDKIIKSAINHDWQTLYKQEIIEREKFHFPPFKFIAKISASRKKNDVAEKFLINLRQSILQLDNSLDISNPIPSFYQKTADKYNWQIIIRTNRRKNLTQIIKQLPPGNFNVDIDPINLL